MYVSVALFSPFNLYTNIHVENCAYKRPKSFCKSRIEPPRRVYVEISAPSYSLQDYNVVLWSQSSPKQELDPFSRICTAARETDRPTERLTDADATESSVTRVRVSCIRYGLILFAVLAVGDSGENTYAVYQKTSTCLYYCRFYKC